MITDNSKWQLVTSSRPKNTSTDCTLPGMTIVSVRQMGYFDTEGILVSQICKSCRQNLFYRSVRLFYKKIKR